MYIECIPADPLSLFDFKKVNHMSEIFVISVSVSISNKWN